MENSLNQGKNITKRLTIWAAIVFLILSVPFFLMQFNVRVYDPGSGYEQVNWTHRDFIAAFMLLFGAASAYEFATRNIKIRKERLMIGLGVFVVLMIIWGAMATS